MAPACFRAILTLSAAFAVLMAACSSGVGGPSPSPEQTKVADTGDLLLTSNRTDVVVCVDAIDEDGPVGEVARSKAESVLRSLQEEDPVWKLAFPPTALAMAHLGCPPPAFDPREDDAQPFWRTRGRNVVVPSEFRIHLYVIPGQFIEDEPYRLIGEEFTCEGDACSEVTGGLYLTPGEICDHAVLSEQLRYALGLAPPREVAIPRGTPVFPTIFVATPSPSPSPAASCY